MKNENIENQQNKQINFFGLVLKSLANLQEVNQKLLQHKSVLESNLKKVLSYLESIKKFNILICI